MEDERLGYNVKQPKAGVEFQGCIGEGYTCECRSCSLLQRARCEELARLDKHYTDDPRSREDSDEE